MIKRKLLGLLITSACVVGGTAFAQDQFSFNDEFNALSSAPGKPNLVVDQDFLYAEPMRSAGLEGLIVKIVNSEGQLVYQERSAGDPLSVYINDLALPNGDYRFEVTALYANDKSPSIIPGLKVSSREYGQFTVEDGVIAKPVQQAPGGDDQAFVAPLGDENSLWMAGLARVVDFFVGSAQAADVTTSPDGDMVIEDDSPSLLIGYGADTQNNDNTILWGLLAYQGAGGTTADFNIHAYTNGGSRDILTIKSGSPADGFNLLANGDATLAGGTVFVDKGTGVHIGDTTTPFGQLQLTGPGALMSLYDESTGGANIIYQSGNEFGVTYSLISTPFTIVNGAPNGALRVTANGTVSTTGSIHVGSTETPVGQFAITESGIVRFEMIDTNASKRWRFTNAGDKFAINQVDTPGTEFSVFENGDATLLGILTENSDVNSKQDIVPVDSGDLLARISQLPIAEWSYIDAPNERHIGPMAQDFHAAFGLGKSDKFIATLDSSGIALAGIKALKAENDRISAENQALRDELDAQKARLAALEESQVEIMATLSTLTSEAQKPLLVAATIDQ